MVLDNLPDVHYDQLIITKDMIPSKDLGINGGYGRHLIIPDDVLQSLSHIVTPQNGVPRIATMDTDGGVNVHVVNGGSGGGGSISPATYNSGGGTYLDFGIATGLHKMVSLPLGVSIIYGAHCSAYFRTTNLTGQSSGTIQIFLTPSVGPGTISLFTASFTFSSPTVIEHPAAQADQMVFNPPIDVASTFPSGCEIWTDNTMGSGVSISVNLLAG